jgi:acyltransferase
MIQEQQASLPGTAPAPKRRIEWIDTAKFIGIFFVMFCHATGKGDIIGYLYSFHLPLFFLLNGLTLRIDPKESFGDFLERKIKAYLIPLFCLGFLCIITDLIMHDALQVEYSWNYVVKTSVALYQQVRQYGLWFVGALFVSDIIAYFIITVGKKHGWISLILAAVQLTIAILFNRYHQQWLMWNLDTAMFGSVFVYVGYLFNRPFNRKPREFLLGKRWISLLAAAVLLVPGMFLAKYIMDVNNGGHLEMWAGLYRPYYVVLPTALINSFGVIFFSRAITSKPLGWLGRSSLVLLAFHQRLSFPIFTEYLAKDWVKGIYAMPLEGNDPHYVYLALAMVAFSLALILPIYCLIIYTPLSFILNRKMLPCYQKMFALIKEKRKTEKAK